MIATTTCTYGNVALLANGSSNLLQGYQVPDINVNISANTTASKGIGSYMASSTCVTVDDGSGGGGGGSTVDLSMLWLSLGVLVWIAVFAFAYYVVRAFTD